MKKIPIAEISVKFCEDITIECSNGTIGDEDFWKKFKEIGGGDRARFLKEYKALCEEYHIREFLEKASEITGRSLFGDVLYARTATIDLLKTEEALRKAKEDKP